MEVKTYTNKGKWFDVKKTQAAFDAMQKAAEDFCRKSDATGVAYIDYDVLEKINADFCGYAEMFRTIDQTVAIILSALNSEFGEEYGTFPESDSGSVKAVFADFCGADGNMGFVKKCQKKFVDFDSELTEHIRQNDTAAFANDINNKTAKAASALNAPIMPQINTEEIGWRDAGGNTIQLNPDFNPEQSYDPVMVLLAYGYTKEQIDAMGALKASEIATSLVNKAYTNPSPLDGFGAFGANQSNPLNSIFALSDDCLIDPNTKEGEYNIINNPEILDEYIIIKDEKKYNIIKNMPMCRNMSKAQIYRELFAMSKKGCTYMIPVNIIFEVYADKEEEFELRFGFPMKDENGDLNFDCLQAYYFLEEGGMVYLNTPNGIDNYVDFKLDYYDMNQDEYREKYGTDLYITDQYKEYEPFYYQNCVNEALELIDKGIYKVKFYDGGTVNSDIDRMNHFLDKHYVLDVDIKELERNPTPERIKEELNNGAAVSLNIANGTFEDSEGNIVYSFKGGHAVTAVDVTEDGRIVVTSWGRRFFYNPTRIRNENERITDGLIIKYNKPDPVTATLKGKPGFTTSPYYDPNWGMDLKQV